MFKFQVKRTNNGFTIVELLIVIVVIAILAAITIVAFNGVQNKAKISVIQSDLTNAAKQLENFKATTSSSESYPSANDCSTTPAGTICLKSSPSTTYAYTYAASTNSYCLSATNGNLVYRYSSLIKNIEEGQCVANTFNNLAWQLQTTNFSGTWSSLDVSDDGTQMIASVFTASSYVFTSTDSGMTWTQRAVPTSTNRSFHVAISGNGQYMAAAATIGEYLLISSDYGVTWNAATTGGVSNWYDVDISSNGQAIYGARSSGGVSVSADYGATWAVRTVAGNTSTNIEVVTSEDGTHVIATRSDRSIWYSANRGVNWVARTIPSVTFYGIAMSSDGSRILASGYNSVDGSSSLRRLYVSTNYGSTWTELTGMGTGYYEHVALSGDGTKAVTVGGVVGTRSIYVSKDFGANWIQQSSIGTGSWSIIKQTLTGSKIFITKGAEFRVGTYD